MRPCFGGAYILLKEADIHRSSSTEKGRVVLEVVKKSSRERG